MSDTEVMSLMQQIAQRWASQRWAKRQTTSDWVGDGEMPASLVQDISQQGWLPETVDEWGGGVALTLARLGEALAQDAASAFLPILTHNLGLHLLGNAQCQVELTNARRGIIATCPYIDYSKVSPGVLAKYDGVGWIVNGYLPWVVNLDFAEQLLLVARESSGSLRLFNVELPCASCTVGDRLSMFGLCGTAVHRVDQISLSLRESNLVASDDQARDRLREGYRVAQWGATGLLAGLVRCFLDQAKEYACLRNQGGRHIIEHAAVRQLIDTARFADEFLRQQLARLESNPQLECPATDIRRQALLASDSALQVFGGSGYICPGLPERCWRDVRQAVTLCSSW